MQYEFVATLDRDGWVRNALAEKDKAKHWHEWRRRMANQSDQIGDFALLPDPSAIAHMPPLSFMLRIPFQLHKPYLSKDERDFYLLDNPLRREKVFQTPMVAATSWKGALRAAMIQQLAAWWGGLKDESRSKRCYHKEFIGRRVQLGRLFGTERGVQPDEAHPDRYLDKVGRVDLARWYRRYVRRFLSPNGFFAGRLYFYPTFFDKVSNKGRLEVINPHSRETGVGERGPILMECVPKETTGNLVLLYVPFGPIDQSEADKRSQIAQDLEVLAEGIKAMLTIYGFGAKTSSGFGTADDRLDGKGELVLRARLADEATSAAAQPEPQQPDPSRDLETTTQLYADLYRPDGSLKPEAEYQTLIESQGRKYTKKNRQHYEKAKRRWERRERQLAEAATQGSEPEPEPTLNETPPVSEQTFRTLSKLCNLAQRVAARLRDGAGT